MSSAFDDPYPLSRGLRRPQVSQHLLQAHRDLSRRIKEYQGQLQHLRDQLVALHEAGAVIEPGRLRLKVARYESRLLSRRSITQAFGAAEYERLVSAIEPVVSLRVTVEEGGGGHRVRPGGNEWV